MKKIFLITLIASLFVFTSCQDAIYEAIREDVKPEEPTVSGNIGSITRYTASGIEFLVLAADNGLRYKLKDDNSHGAWSTYPLPFSLHTFDFDSSSHVGEQLITVLADSKYLYILSAAYDHTNVEGISYPSNIKLWGKLITASGDEWDESGDWTLIIENDDDFFPVYVTTSEYYSTAFKVFQTNSPMKAHRAAFVRSLNYEDTGYKYYCLNGLSKPVEVTVADSDIIDPEPSTDEDYLCGALSAVYFNGEIKFFTSPAATTNETYTKEASCYYYTNSDEKLYWSDGTSVSTLECNSIITALATTADSVLIGYGNPSRSSGGIDRASIFEDGKPKDTIDFETNAKFQITSSYIVLTLLNATPDQKELDSALYASITFTGGSYNFDNIGLWSYYPERENWNRE